MLKAISREYNRDTEKPLISVVVPVYNAENFIERCIKSVLSQSYTNIELILVNDGSTDRSGEICESYEKQDSRVKVFSKENGGVSSARNVALEAMNGEWVTFIDADDLLLPDAIIDLSSLIDESTDFILGDFETLFCGKEETQNHPDLSSRFKEEYIASDWVAVWGSLMRSKIIKGNRIVFPDKIRYNEDFNFVANFLANCQGIRRLNRVVYHYNRDNESSATHKADTTVVFHQRKALLLCAAELSTYTQDLFWEKGLCWRLLMVEQSLATDRSRFNDFRSSYVRKVRYIGSCPYISRKMKIIMRLVLNNQDLIPSFLLFLGKLIKR